VNTLLGDILNHVTKDHVYENLQQQLQSIVIKILTHYQDIVTVFAMDKFIPLLDLFHAETQVEVNKLVLQYYARSAETSTDPVIINAMFEGTHLSTERARERAIAPSHVAYISEICIITVGKTVHDSINALSFADDIRQISTYISAFIRKVDYGDDLEKQLNFYVDCRRAFANLDSVKAMLVQCACGLAMRTLSKMNGAHSRRTAAFVRVRKARTDASALSLAFRPTLTDSLCRP